MLVVKYVEPWAVDHRQRWNTEALQKLGERVIVRHRWNIEDFSFGRCQRCTICSASVNINESQRIRVLRAVGGTYTLQMFDQPTAPIPWNQTPDGVKLALEELDYIDSGDVFVSENPVDGYDVEFRGQWTNRHDIPLLVADATNLIKESGNYPAEVEVLQKTAGQGGPDIRSRVTEVYKQSGNSWCPSCYGIGFEGGFEPIIYVTFAIIGDQQAETTRTKSGVIQMADPIAQFSFEPIVQEFDIVARIKSWESDKITPKDVAGRFQIGEVRPTTIRTGPRTVDDSLTYLPPDKRDVYQIPDDTLIVGQQTKLTILPYEHPYHLIPLTYYEERLVEAGLEPRHREYYEEVKQDVPMIRGD